MVTSAHTLCCPVERWGDGPFASCDDPHMEDPTGHPGLVPRLDGYQFDVFVSYRRSGPGNAATWVRNYFHRMLEDCLADELGRTAVFIDSEVETGAVWPPLLREALARSKILVAVWSPPYFHSPWCLAEWRTMEARERALGGTARLVYPVRSPTGTTSPTTRNSGSSSTCAGCPTRSPRSAARTGRPICSTLSG